MFNRLSITKSIVLKKGILLFVVLFLSFLHMTCDLILGARTIPPPSDPFMRLKQTLTITITMATTARASRVCGRNGPSTVSDEVSFP